MPSNTDALLGGIFAGVIYLVAVDIIAERQYQRDRQRWLEAL